MTFLYDLTASQPTRDGKFHGGGKYAKKVFETLVKSCPPNINFLALIDSSKPLDSEIQLVINECNVCLVDIRNSTIKTIIEENFVDKFYSALPFDISFKFSCSFNTRAEVIGTIHGLRELETALNLEALKYFNSFSGKVRNLFKILFKKFLYKKKYKLYGTLLTKIKVITVSYHSKFSIQSYYPQSSEIHVFYSPDVTDYNRISLEKIEWDDYFLLVNGNRWIKNNLKAAIALDQLFSEGRYINKKVIITGVTNKKLYLRYIKNKERFVFLGFVDEDYLEALYKNAFAFIYMTLNEGFGYPPLEAMKHSIPVIASPFTSLTEICGDAALYSNPFSIAEIKNRILQLTDVSFYNNVCKRGRERYEYISSKQKQDLVAMVDFLFN